MGESLIRPLSTLRRRRFCYAWIARGFAGSTVPEAGNARSAERYRSSIGQSNKGLCWANDSDGYH